LSLQAAQARVATHLPTLVRLLEGCRAVLGHTEVVAEGVCLRGLAPEGPAPVLPEGAEGAWLVRGEEALPLEPLAHHGVVQRVGPDGQRTRHTYVLADSP
jgi:hypothetical protein